MIKKQYQLVESEIKIEGEMHTTFGICGENICIQDVSVDRQKVENMLKEINNANLEECHLEDYIYDELI